MGALADQLATDLTASMKARDQLRTSTLRMAIAAVKEASVAGREAKELSDEEVVAVLRTQVKRRDEAAEAFRAGGRDEQADAELAEREVLAAYLPASLSDDELASIAARVVAAGGFAELGPAMKATMAEVAGRADGKRVQAAVRAVLPG